MQLLQFNVVIFGFLTICLTIYETGYQITYKGLEKITEVVNITSITQGFDHIIDRWKKIEQSDPCDSRNLTKLEDSLEQLIGQEKAKTCILDLIRKQTHSSSPKPIVLDLFGVDKWGTQMAYEIIISSLFPLGGQSSHVKFVSAEFHLKENSSTGFWISTVLDLVKNCNNSVIIYDDVEKLPNLFLENTLLPILKNSVYDSSKLVIILTSHLNLKDLNELMHKNGVMEDFESQRRDMCTGIFKTYVDYKFIPFSVLSDDDILECFHHARKQHDKAGYLKSFTNEEIFNLLDQQKLYSFTTCNAIVDVVRLYVTAKSLKG